MIPYDLAVEQMKKFIVKSYGRKGEDVVNKNYAAVDRGGEITKIDIPAEWANLPCSTDFAVEKHDGDPEFIAKVMRPMVAQTGNDLPVSAFVGYEDGTFPAGTTAYEKRGVATVVPEWIAENCIQCNQCSLVCPHAAIRPCVMTDEEMKNAPESMKAIDIKMPKELAGMHFRMQVSAMDCTGCGNCADVCPAKEKALVMKPFESQPVPQVHHPALRRADDGGQRHGLLLHLRRLGSCHALLPQLPQRLRSRLGQLAV